MRIVFLVFLFVIGSISTAHAADLKVGSDGTFKTLNAAIKASAAGDTIFIQAGNYENDFSIIRHNLSIRSTGGIAWLRATGPIPNGKGILVTKANVYLEGLGFGGARVPSRNGAGIRYQKGTLILENCHFESNENGILGAAASKGHITIRNSTFRHNGYGDGYTHGIYIGEIESLVLKDSVITDTHIGHHLKSRASRNEIIGNLLDDGTERSSYAIDLPNGGENLVSGNTIIQNATPENNIIISTGTRATWTSNSLTIQNNHFINYSRNGTMLRNAMPQQALLKNNYIVGKMTIAMGPHKKQDNLLIDEPPQSR